MISYLLYHKQKSKSIHVNDLILICQIPNFFLNLVFLQIINKNPATMFFEELFDEVAKVIVKAAAEAVVEAGRAVIEVAAEAVVEVAAAAVEIAAAAVETAAAFIKDAAAVIEAFFRASSGTLMSAEEIDYPPISTVLANHGRADLRDSMRSAVKTSNANAMDNIGKQLTKLGLDYIFEAFKRAIRDNLRCSKCRNNVASLDDLCYCPGAATNCHHNSKSCCVHHRERGMFDSSS